MKNTATSITVGALALAFLAVSSHADYTLTVATADATKGSVTAAGGTYPEGTAVTITATPESGYTFTRWDGVHPSLRLDNPLVLPVTNDTAVTAVFGKTYYVATTGSDSTADGTNPATPYKTIEKAVAAASDGDTVSIGPGTFAGSAAITISSAIVLRGQGMAATARSAVKTTLNNANAIAADMRFTGFSGAGTVTITKGTVLRCDISGNSSTTANGVGMRCEGNSIIVGSVITNNICGTGTSGGGTGVGVSVTAGPVLFEDCLIADNTTGFVGGCGGIAINYKDTTHSKPAILRHCTIVRNSGGEGASTCGGLFIVNNDVKVLVEGCLIGGNAKFSDESAEGTDDVFLGLSVNTQGLRVFRDTVISHMSTPSRSAYFTFENCVSNVAPGFADLLGRDFTVTRRSPAWGLCADGSDAGCFQSPRDGSFDVGCYPLTNSVCGRLETPLVAKAENAPGDVTFEWDLDGDGVFETSGPVATGIWTAPGLHAVTIRATAGGQTVTRTLPNLVYVAPREIFAWPGSPSPAFPYATWDTAAHTVNEAVAAAEDGCKVQLTNAFYQVSASVRVCRNIEICGTGTANNSVKGDAGSATGRNVIDANATGTCVQGLSGGGAPFRLYRSGILLHNMAIGPGSPIVVGLYDNATVSNCVIRSGHNTVGSGVNIYARSGLVTHCVISNGYTTKQGSGGSIYLIQGGATLRNSLVCDANHKQADGANPACGTVYAGAGCTVESCTIVNNKATLGGGLYTTGAAIVRNNIIRDNLAPADATGHPDWYDSDGNALFSNNCTPTAHNTGDATVTDDPSFIYENGRNTYTFATGSHCVDKGVAQPWMSAGSIDLFGNVRLQGDAPDIGCFEADMTEMTCDISASPSAALGESAVTLSAVIAGGTPPAGAQYLWDLDGDGETDATGPTVTVTFPEGRYTIGLKVKDGDEVLFDITKDDAFTIYPFKIYLVASNPDCAFPYNTLETAATNVNEAIDAALDGAEIVVFEGNHRAYRKILIDKAITLHAAPGLAERPQIKRYVDASDIFFTVGNADALIEGLVIDNRQKATHALNITVAGGTVRDCVVSNGYYSVGSGIGLTIANGLFDRGVIVGTSAAGSDSGLAVHMSGNARVSNSLIHRNTIRSGSKNGVVYLTGNARLENCTVVSNTCGAKPAVYCSNTADGGKAAVVNCVIRDNYFKSEPEEAYPGGADWFVSATAESIAWSNNCAAVAFQVGDGTVTDAPLFRDPAKADYTPLRKSPTRNAGIWRDWMDGTALDLLGNPRVRGVLPDIGCYEFSGTDPLILFAK